MTVDDQVGNYEFDGGRHKILVESSRETILQNESIVIANMVVINHDKIVENTPRANNQVELSDFYQGNSLIGGIQKDGLRAVSEMDRTKVQKIIETFAHENPDILRRYQINSLSDMSASQAVYFTTELVSRSLDYAHHIIPEYVDRLDEDTKAHVLDLQKTSEYEERIKELQQRYKQMTADEILEHRAGVCDQYAKASMGVYEVLKDMSLQHKLDNTFLLYHGNLFLPQEGAFIHAFNTFVAVGEGRVVISSIDPTWFVPGEAQGNVSEIDVRDRFLSIMEIFNDQKLLNKLGLSFSDLAELANKRADQIFEELKNGTKLPDQGIAYAQYEKLRYFARVKEREAKRETNSADYTQASSEAGMDTSNLVKDLCEGQVDTKKWKCIQGYLEAGLSFNDASSFDAHLSLFTYIAENISNAPNHWIRSHIDSFLTRCETNFADLQESTGRMTNFISNTQFQELQQKIREIRKKFGLSEEA
jgi:hypothetical protein